MDSFKEVISHVEIPCILFTKLDGNIVCDYLNSSSRSLLGYDSSDDLLNKPIGQFISIPNINNDPECSVRDSLKTSTGLWVNTEIFKKDTNKVSVGINAVEFTDDGTFYILAVVRDRTESVRADKELRDALSEVTKQKAEADLAKEEAEKAKEEAEKAKEAAEVNLANHRKLSAQIELLRYVFKGVLFLIIMLAALVTIGWFSGKYEKESLAMFERILLVLTGMLGTAMAGVFDSKRQVESSK